MTSVLMKRGNLDTDIHRVKTHKRRPCDWSGAPAGNAKVVGKPQKLEEAE